MKSKISILAVVLLLWASAAVAQKQRHGMDEQSEKNVQIVQGPSITNNTGSTATLTWTTNKQGANHVQYRPAGSNGQWKSEYERGGGTNHSLQLTGLNSGQTYEFQILTQDGDIRTSGQFQAGNGNTNVSMNGSPNASPVSNVPSTGSSPASSGDKVTLYRAVGPNGAHTFTTSASPQAGFTNEGVAGYVLSQQRQATIPLYRLTNAAGDTLLTTNEAERNSAMGSGFQDGGVVGYIAQNRWGGTQPLYRMIGTNGTHFYTTSDSEHASAQQQGYRDESTIGYVWTQQ